MKSIKV